MRIVAGKHRGRVLAQFKGFDVRPTSDRVKESLFQILTPRLAGARVLDLFCGSGALGLEALSRGAKEATFNDASASSAAICKKNLAALRERGIVQISDWRACLMRAAGQFDLIFCDPPYAMDVAGEVLAFIAQRRLLAAFPTMRTRRGREALARLREAAEARRKRAKRGRDETFGHR